MLVLHCRFAVCRHGCSGQLHPGQLSAATDLHRRRLALAAAVLRSNEAGCGIKPLQVRPRPSQCAMASSSKLPQFRIREPSNSRRNQNLWVSTPGGKERGMMSLVQGPFCNDSRSVQRRRRSRRGRRRKPPRRKPSCSTSRASPRSAARRARKGLTASGPAAACASSRGP